MTNLDHNDMEFISSVKLPLDNSQYLFKMSNAFNWHLVQELLSNDVKSKVSFRKLLALYMLKKIGNFSEQEVIARWAEDFSFQFLGGIVNFSSIAPCTVDELNHFEKAIGEDGERLILDEVRRAEKTISESDDDNESYNDVDESYSESGLLQLSFQRLFIVSL
jgi:hypothetical protein